MYLDFRILTLIINIAYLICGEANYIVVDRSKISKEITSFDGLWDSDFKNSMVILDDPRVIVRYGPSKEWIFYKHYKSRKNLKRRKKI